MSSSMSLSPASEFSTKPQTALKRGCAYDGREGVTFMPTLSTACALDKHHCPDTNDNIKVEATSKSTSSEVPTTWCEAIEDCSALGTKPVVLTLHDPTARRLDVRPRSCAPFHRPDTPYPRPSTQLTNAPCLSRQPSLVPSTVGRTIVTPNERISSTRCV
jgi:hypothetical protein